MAQIHEGVKLSKVIEVVQVFSQAIDVNKLNVVRPDSRTEVAYRIEVLTVSGNGQLFIICCEY